MRWKPIQGRYHHVSEAHLGRYLSEFDFRYNTRADLGFTGTTRADAMLKPPLASA